MSELDRQELDEPEEGADPGAPAAGAPPTAPSSSSPAIRRGDRALAVGKTGEGKSEVLLHLWSIFRGQRLLIDVQDHYELGPAALDEPALDVESVREIDWRYRTIRYVPAKLSQREFDELFQAIYARGNLLVLLDEAEDAAPSSGPPRWVKKVAKQGRKRRITLLSASQRPVGVDRSIINQSEHAFVFRMVDVDDITTLSYRLGMRPRELAELLGSLERYEYLRHTIGERELVRMPPLPGSIIAATRRHVINPH